MNYICKPKTTKAMTAKEIREHVDVIIENTFKKLQAIYDGEYHEPNGCRLIFPLKRDNECRISEQELRFVFTEVFTLHCEKEKLEWFYSVETPTLNTYFFSKGKKAKDGPFPRPDDKGESANFDFVVHNKNRERICLIEFKAHKKDTIHKDYTKLIYDPFTDDKDNGCDKYATHTQCYFIEIVNNKSKNVSIKNKFEEKLKCIETEINHNNGIIYNYTTRIRKNEHPDLDRIRFYCYSLPHKSYIIKPDGSHKKESSNH